MTVFLKVKLKGWFVAGWPSSRLPCSESLAQAWGLGRLGGAKRANAGWSADAPVWEQKRSTAKALVTVHKVQYLCPEPPPPTQITVICCLETRRRYLISCKETETKRLVEM